MGNTTTTNTTTTAPPVVQAEAVVPAVPQHRLESIAQTVVHYPYGAVTQRRLNGSTNQTPRVPEVKPDGHGGTPRVPEVKPDGHGSSTNSTPGVPLTPVDQCYCFTGLPNNLYIGGHEDTGGVVIDYLPMEVNALDSKSIPETSDQPACLAAVQKSQKRWWMFDNSTKLCYSWDEIPDSIVHSIHDIYHYPHQWKQSTGSAFGYTCSSSNVVCNSVDTNRMNTFDSSDTMACFYSAALDHGSVIRDTHPASPADGMINQSETVPFATHPDSCANVCHYKTDCKFWAFIPDLVNLLDSKCYFYSSVPDAVTQGKTATTSGAAMGYSCKGLIQADGPTPDPSGRTTDPSSTTVGGVTQASGPTPDPSGRTTDPSSTTVGGVTTSTTLDGVTTPPPEWTTGTEKKSKAKKSASMGIAIGSACGGVAMLAGAAFGIHHMITEKGSGVEDGSDIDVDSDLESRNDSQPVTLTYEIVQ